MVRSAKNAAGADTEPITIRLPRRLIRSITQIQQLPYDSPIRQRMREGEYPTNKGGVVRWLIDDERAALLIAEHASATSC
jgi:hypothetical protein